MRANTSTSISSLLLMHVILIMFAAAHRTCCVDAAVSSGKRSSSASRGNSFDNSHYDRSITTFSSDGRLLQVEYGATAAGRGTTVACLDLDCISATSRRGVVVAVVRSSSSGCAFSFSASPFSDKVHRIDDHAILVTSGLSGDSRALASSARVGCQRLRLSFGEAPALSEVANLVGSTQHELTRMGGRRPFGVSAIVIGVDPLPDTSNDDPLVSDSGTPVLFRTDPGGTVDRCNYCAIGNNAEKALAALDALESDKLIENHSLVRDEEKGEPIKGQESILANIVHKVALAALDAGSDPSSGTDADTDTKSDQALLDIWLVEPAPRRRGGSIFRVAKAVKRRNLIEASRVLAASNIKVNSQ